MAGKGDKPRNCFSQEFRNHFDEINWGSKPLKTPDEWSRLKGYKIIDPDGWRQDKKNWNEPITEAEFNERAFLSTMIGAHTKA